MMQYLFILLIILIAVILTAKDFKRYVSELEIRYHLADLYNRTNNFQAEVDEYRIILTINPDDINANYRIGHF